MQLNINVSDIGQIGRSDPSESITTHVTRYTADNILVMLDWTPEDGVSYSVTTISQVTVVFNASTSAQLVLFYNTHYNTMLVF